MVPLSMKLSVVYLLAILYPINSFNVKPSIPDVKCTTERIKNAIHSLAIKSLPLVLGASLFLANPPESNAVPSGGRSGGSSFRSAPRGYGGGGSSTRLGSGSYAPYRSTTIVPVPMYSPFGYGFGGFGGFGLSPFGYMPLNGNLVLLAGAAYVAYSVLQNRAGGSDFFGNDDGGSMQSGATVLKLQIALDEDWGQSGNIMDTMAMLCSRNSRGTRSLSTRSEISSLLSDAAMSLLRKKGQWNSAAVEGEKFSAGQSSGDNVEKYFQRIVVQERAKFDKETRGGGNRNGIMDSSPFPGGSIDAVGTFGRGVPTQAVVSVIVALAGSSDALRKAKSLGSVSDVAACLQMLAAEALTDDGQNVMAVEVLWTPSERGSRISERDLVTEYPELMKL